MSTPRLRLNLLVSCFCYRAIAGLAVAAPVSMGVASVVGHHPRGDAVLWEAGGTWLIECGRLLGPSMPARLGIGALLALLFAFGWLLPLGALIASLSAERLRGWQVVRRAWARLGALMLMLGMMLFASTVIIAAMGGIAGVVDAGSRTRDMLRVALAASGLLLCFPLALAHDAARVLWIQQDLTVWQLVLRTYRVFRRRGGAVLLAAGWRTLIAMTALGAAGVAAVAFTGGTDDSPGLVVAAQLAAVLVFVLMRASWLRWLTPVAQQTE